MKSHNLYPIFLSLVLLTALFFPGKSSGETGLAFIKMPVSARSAAGMGVFTQMSASPIAVFENPVGIQNPDPTLSLSHGFWFTDISSDVFAFSIPIRRGTFATGFDFVRIPGIQIRETPTEEPLNEIEAQFLTIGAGYSQQIRKRLTVGASVKYLYENLYTESGHGYAFDFSGRWLAPSSLDVSILVQNLGKMDKLDNEPTTLPRLLKIGIVRPDIFIEDPFRVSVGVSLETNLDTKESGARIGTEICIKNILSLHAGYQQVGSLNRKSVGFSVQTKRFELD
ncbi:MAG: hypothetical protein WC703_10750, partial [Candidatus Neomarinimicrobiota bacterium]